MKSHLSSILKFAIGWPLSLVALFFIGKIIYDQIPSVLPNIQSINPFLVAAGLFCFLLFYFLRSFIWYRIVKSYGSKLTFKSSSYMWSVSELKRYIPGNIWSFLGRAVLFSNEGIKKKDLSAGFIIEAELFILGCVVVSILAIPFLLSDPSLFFSYGATILVSIILLLYIFNRQIVSKFPAKLLSVIHFLFPAFPPKEIFLLIIVSTSAVFFFGLGNYLVMSAAFGTDPQLMWQLIGVFVFAFIAGYLSFITPAGFGVREGITIFALTKLVSSGLAAFAALFTRLILIVAEVLFIAIVYLWHKSANKSLHKIEKWIATHIYESIVIFLSSVYALYFSVVSVLRYDNYYTGRFDLGNMVQTVWNTLHGNFFMMTNPDSVGQVSRLAFHADFILILLAPFYALWQDPRMLLIIQSIVVAAGAYFIFLIAKAVLKDNNLALVFSFAYLINPGVQRANIYDFHAVVLATTLLLATFYFYMKRKYVLFLVFAVLAAFCKEQIWLIVALFGLLVLVHHRKWIFGSGIFLFSIGMFFFLIEYAIPNSLGANHFALEYYSGFGSSPLDIVKSIILSPDKVLQTILEPDRFRFITQIFSPLGYLSYAFPFFLIFAGPDLLISLLSSNSNLYQIYYQYTATMTPFIFLSAIYGVWVITKIANKASFRLVRNQSIDPGQARMTMSIILIGYILYWSLHTAYMFGPLPGSKEPNTAMFNRPFQDRVFIDQFLAQIPQNYSVAASNNLGSHLSQREVIYVLPHGIDLADMVLISDKDNYAKKTITAMEQNVNYRKVVDRNGFVVYEKNK